MRKSKKVAAAASVISLTSVMAASAVMPGASAATPGVGTANATTELVHIALDGTKGPGGLIDARLISDTATSTLDPSQGDPHASTKITPFAIAAAANSTAPAINFVAPKVGADSPGDNPNATYGGVDLAAPSALIAGLPAVASGKIGAAQLSTSATPAGSTTGLTGAALSGIRLLGGLVGADTPAGGVSNVATAATPASSTATRTVTIPTVRVLGLNALLELSGVKLSALPVSTITGLVTTLKLPVAGITSGATASAVTTLNGAITSLQTAVAPGATTVTGTVDKGVNSVLGSVGIAPLVSGTTTVATVNADITTLQTTLAGDLGPAVLADAVTKLAAAPLLQLNGGTIGVSTTATDDLATSSATVTGKLNGFTVGGVAINGVDLTGDTAKVQGVLNTTISGVLGKVNPALAGLVKVSLLDAETPMTVKDGDYTKATAGLTALTATLTPPSLDAIKGVLGGLAAGAAGSVGTAAGSALPAQSPDVLAFEKSIYAGIPALAPVVGLLTAPLPLELLPVFGAAGVGGGSIKVGSIHAASNFAPTVVTPTAATPSAATPASAPAGQLPKTGGTIVLAGLGSLLVALGLWFRKASALSQR